MWSAIFVALAIAKADHRLYDLDVTEDREPSRYAELDEVRGRSSQPEPEPRRHSSHEQLLVKTLVSATSHATAIRESARREAELTLRKARAEAEKIKAGAERERDDAKRELMRLRRVTEQMKSGLTAFLTAKVEELRLETAEGTMHSGQGDELEAALGGALEGRSSELRSEPESAADRRSEVLDRGGYGSTGGSPHALP